MLSESFFCMLSGLRIMTPFIVPMVLPRGSATEQVYSYEKNAIVIYSKFFKRETNLIK